MFVPKLPNTVGLLILILRVKFIQANHLFYPKIGLYLEQYNPIAIFDNYHMEVLTYILPESVIYNLPESHLNCTTQQEQWGNQINLIYNNKLNDLKLRIPEYTTKSLNLEISNGTRGKREPITLAVMSLIGLMGLGGTALGIYNTIAITSAASKLNSIQEAVNNMVNEKEHMIITANKIINDLNNLTKFIDKQVIDNINDLNSGLSCMNNMISGFVATVQDFVMSIPFTAESIYIDSINGVLTTRIINQEKLGTILAGDEYDNSLYRTNNLLFYELAKFKLYSVTHEPFSIVGVVMLPAIYNQVIGLQYKINTVNYMVNDANYQLNLPNYCVLNTQLNYFWSPDGLQCIKSPSITLCPTSIMESSRIPCLTDIYINSEEGSNSCESIQLPHNKSIYKYLGDKLLLGIGDYTITNVERGTNTPMSYSLQVKEPTCLDVSSYLKVRINNHVFDIFKNPIINKPTVSDVHYNITPYDTSVKHYAVILDNVESSQKVHFKFAYFNISTSVIIIFVIITIIYKLYSLDSRVRVMSYNQQMYMHANPINQMI